MLGAENMTAVITAVSMPGQYIVVPEDICPVALAEQIKRVRKNTAKEAYQCLAGDYKLQEGRPDPSGLFFHFWEPVEGNELSLDVENNNCLLYYGPLSEFDPSIIHPN